MPLALVAAVALLLLVTVPLWRVAVGNKRIATVIELVNAHSAGEFQVVVDLEPRALIEAHADRRAADLVPAVHLTTGLALMRLERVHEALERFAAAVPEADHLDDPTSAPILYGIALARLGRYDEAVEQFEVTMVRESANAHPNRQHHSGAVLMLAEIALRRDDPDRAIELLAEALRIAEPAERGVRAIAEATEAELAHQLGDHERALAAADAARAGFEVSGGDHFQLGHLATINARSLARTGDRVGAAGAVEQARAHQADAQHPRLDISIAWADAELAAIAGDETAAIGLLAEAALAAEAIEDPRLAVDLRTERALLLARTRAEDAATATAVTAAISECDALTHRRQARELRAALA